MGSFSKNFIVYTLATPVVVVFAHVVLARLGMDSRKSVSPQGFLAKLIVVLNIPVLAGAISIGVHEKRPGQEMLAMALYAFVVFNCISYAYFHFFNMSETARRVKIAIQISEQGGDAAQLLQSYLTEDMVATRLDRLVQMGQLTVGEDGRYRIEGRLLLFAARLYHLHRRLLGVVR